MLDIESLPLTIAESSPAEALQFGEVKFSYTENTDKQLYLEINQMLVDLERSEEVDTSALQEIRNLTNRLKTSINDKQEILIRMDWLDRLYQVKEELTKLESLVEAKKLRKLLAPVQTCPLKKKLLDEMKTIENSFRVEKAPITEEQQLMDRAMKEIGADFIYLGKTGREYVVRKVIDAHHQDVTMEQVREYVLTIQKNVESLKECETQEELVRELQQIPLHSFSSFDASNQEAIAALLLKDKKWNGLYSLERLIQTCDQAITAEQKQKLKEENHVLTSDGTAAFTLYVELDERGVIKID